MKKTLKELFDFFPEVNYIAKDSCGHIFMCPFKPEFDSEYETYITDEQHIFAFGVFEVDFGDKETNLNVCVSREEFFKEEKPFQLNAKDENFIKNICMSYRHDFGLIPKGDQQTIKNHILIIIDSINKNIGIMKHD